MKKSTQTAIMIRKFNRFYLPYFHLLTQKYLNTEYSVAEARILYEIYENERISAKEIVHHLHVDKSYLSRILKKFEMRGLIDRKVSEHDCRLTIISLTEAGKQLSEELIGESIRQVENEIIGLSDEDLDRLSYHMDEIIGILEKEKES